MIYLIILCIIFFLAFLDVADEDVYPKYKNILFVGLFIVLFIVAGFRYYTGYDYSSYNEIFSNAQFSNILSTKIEVGFLFLICILKKIGLGFSALILVMAFTSLLFKYRAIKEYSVYPFVSLFIYFSTNFIIQDFGQIRQGLAIALTLYSIKYIKENRIYKYLMLILIATMFHYSVVIFLPMYWISKIQINNKLIISTLIVSIVFFIISKIGIVDYLILNVIKNDYISNKYNAYMATGGMLGFAKLTFISTVVVFAAFYYLKDKIETNCKYYNILAMGYFMSIVMYIVFNFNAGLATRGGLYFRILEIFIIPEIIYAVKDKLIVFNCLMITYVFAFKNLFFEISSQQEKFIPYKSLITEFLKWIFKSTS